VNEGGDDTAEDLQSALRAALDETKMKWTAKQKFLIIITDSPGHGQKYHKNTIYDEFPEDDLTKELTQLADKDIRVIGVSFTRDLPYMYDQFKCVMIPNGGDINQIDMIHVGEFIRTLEEKKTLPEEVKSQEIRKFIEQVVGVFIQKITSTLTEFSNVTRIKARNELKANASSVYFAFFQTAQNKDSIAKLIASDKEMNEWDDMQMELSMITLDESSLDNYSDINSMKFIINPGPTLAVTYERAELSEFHNQRFSMYRFRLKKQEADKEKN